MPLHSTFRLRSMIGAALAASLTLVGLTVAPASAEPTASSLSASVGSTLCSTAAASNLSSTGQLGATIDNSWIDNILTNLVNGAASTAGGDALNWILTAAGVNFGDAAQLSAMQTELQQITAQLNTVICYEQAISNQITTTACSTFVQDVAPIVGDAAAGMRYLSAMTQPDVSDSTRTTLISDLNTLVTNRLESDQLALHLKLGPQAPADGLITECGKAWEIGQYPFLSYAGQLAFRQQFYDYYRAIAAQILLLRVNYWTALGMSGSWVTSNIIDPVTNPTTGYLAQEAALFPAKMWLNPSFIDKRTGYMWYGVGAGGAYSWPCDFNTNGYCNYNYGNGSVVWPAAYSYLGLNWLRSGYGVVNNSTGGPYAFSLQDLIAGYKGTDAASWLAQPTGAAVTFTDTSTTKAGCLWDAGRQYTFTGGWQWINPYENNFPMGNYCYLLLARRTGSPGQYSFDPSTVPAWPLSATAPVAAKPPVKDVLQLRKGATEFCAGQGDRDSLGSSLEVGAPLHLAANQPDTDRNYAFAKPAYFVEGMGLTCAPPTGYVWRGELVSADGKAAGPYLELVSAGFRDAVNVKPIRSATAKISVGNFVKLRAGFAVQRVRLNGLSVRIKHVRHSTAPRGAVISQSLRAGSKVKPGSVILLVVSSGL